MDRYRLRSQHPRKTVRFDASERGRKTEFNQSCCQQVLHTFRPGVVLAIDYMQRASRSAARVRWNRLLGHTAGKLNRKRKYRLGTSWVHLYATTRRKGSIIRPSGSHGRDIEVYLAGDGYAVTRESLEYMARYARRGWIENHPREEYALSGKVYHPRDGFPSGYGVVQPVSLAAKKSPPFLTTCMTKKFYPEKGKFGQRLPLLTAN